DDHGHCCRSANGWCGPWTIPLFCSAGGAEGPPLLCPEFKATTTRSATMLACAAVAAFTPRTHHRARANLKGTSVKSCLHCRHCVVRRQGESGAPIFPACSTIHAR